MSTFLYALGRKAYRAPFIVIGIWVAVLAIVAAGVLAFAQDFDDDFTLPGSEAQEALDSLQVTFPEASGVSASVVVVAADGHKVTDDDYEDAIKDTIDELSDLDHVDNVASPFSDMVSGAISSDESAAMINVAYDGSVEDIGEDAPDKLEHTLDGLREALPGSQVEAGGELYQMTSVEISWVEGVGVVIAFFVLLLTLGSFRAAGMPLLSALLGVGISVLLVVGATAFGSINSTSIMLALMLGLAVGIDYALFIVSRARSLQAAGHDPFEAAGRANATAGSAVVFAGITVMIALLGLSLAQIPFLTIMGIGASGAVAIAVMISLTMTPALLGLAKGKIKPKERRIKNGAAKGNAAKDSAANNGAAKDSAASNGTTTSAGARPGPVDRFFSGWLRVVTRIPVLTIIVIVGGLALFAIPATQLQLSLPTAGQQDKGTPARINYDLIAEHFGPGYNGPLVMTSNIVTSDDPLGDVKDIENEIKDVPGVEEVIMATPNRDATTALFQIIPTTASDDPATLDTVNHLRDLSDDIEDEYGYDTAVTGATAIQIDVSDRLGSALVPFGAFVVGLSIILLMIVFRSIAVPIKATGGFLLSVIASFGAVVLVFHDGFLNGPIGLDQTGPVISFLPIILMGILFGLAMDYEVFLVSGMREAYVHGATAKEAIRAGFLGSARVVTAAAIIMFSVFAAFVPAGEPIIKSIALALAVGIFVDAFLVRMSLVPAIMQLLGDKAWWLPKWLDRILPRVDVEGEGLAHEVALREWPEPNSPYRVYARGIGISAGRAGFGQVDLGLLPGQTLVVTGEARRALLLALSGRVALTTGQMKVGQMVLPEHAGQVRRAVPYFGLSLDSLVGATGPVPAAGPATASDRASAADSAVGVPVRGLPSSRAVEKLRNAPPDLLVVDGAEALAQPSARSVRDALWQMRQQGTALVLGLAENTVGGVLEPNADYLHLDLDAAEAERQTTNDNGAVPPGGHSNDELEGVQS